MPSTFSAALTRRGSPRIAASTTHPALGGALAVTALLALQVALVVGCLDGHLVYTLDDPYIHLALAAQIAQGHYGLHPGAAAAPSSSILYPFLLAPLELIGLGTGAPMAINAAAAAANGAMIAVLIDGALPAMRRARAAAVVGLTALAAVELNVVGVAMTGMEHGLQVALTLAWLLGARRFLRAGSLAPWWWLAAASAPFVRYEGVALSVATVALLALRGRPRAALGLLAAVGTGLAAFSLSLHAMGLPWLPSSVLVKAQQTGSEAAIARAGVVHHFAANTARNLLGPQGLLLLAEMIALALVAARSARSRDADGREIVALCLVGLWISAAQIVGAAVDGFSRYAVHASAFDAMVATIGLAPVIRAAAGGRGRAGAVVGAAAGLGLSLALTQVNVQRSVHAYTASRNIYEQQFQMHRLAADVFRAPVAVNDLGLVSFDNPYPVLDLWGLGSEEARVARLGDPSGRWIGPFVARRGIGLAMIYAEAFPRIPDGWVLCGELHLAGPRESAAGSTVSLYATGPERVAAVSAALDRWAPGLPAGVRLARGPARADPPAGG